MAMTYQNFASLGVNLNRQKYGPLDISNVFTSAADLKYYLTKGTFTEGVSEYWYKNANEKIVPYPYEGQVLATVIDGIVKVYVLSLDAEGSFQAKAIEPDVDGKTIVKNANGELAIVAPENADASKSYNFSYANGVYSWVEVDTATAAGQAQAIAGLTDRAVALETTVNGKAAVGAEGEEGYQPAVEGLVDKVASHAANIAALEAAIADALEDAKDYADEQIEANAYDDTDVKDRIATLETASGDHESRIVEVEKFFKVADGESIKEALDTLVEIQKEIEDDNTGASAMLADIAANAAAIELLNKTDGTVGSVKKTVDDAIAAANLSQYATVDALNGVAEDVIDLENALLGYATNETIEVINATLATKIESGTIAHAVPAVETDPENGIEAVVGVPEGVTVDGTALRIVVDAPTRAETVQMIADKVAAVTGGESAAAVKLSLEAEVERSTSKDTAHDEALAVLQGAATVSGSVAAAYAKGEEGVAAAAAVAADLDAAELVIADNTREIGVVKGQVSTLNTTLTEKITALEGKDTVIEGNITALQTTVGGHTATITGHTTSIAALEAKDAELAVLIQANADKFANYYTSGQVDSKVKEVSDAVNAIDLTPYAKAADVNTSIQGINAELATKADAANVYTKDEANAEFMTEAEVDARIDILIKASDPENGKTIENIQNLVKYVDENAGEIAKLVTDVATNKAAHEKNATDISTNVAAIAAINTSLAAIVQPKASTEISVAADGTLGINEVNVNKLVQTAGDTLVLNGGSAAL